MQSMIIKSGYIIIGERKPQDKEYYKNQSQEDITIQCINAPSNIISNYC